MASTHRARRVLIAVVGSLALIGGTWILMAGALLAWSGVSTVSIRATDGPALTFPVPMAAIEMVAWTAPRLVGADLEQITVEADLGELAPAVLALAKAFDDLPDGTLLEIDDHDETVRIWQQGGKLRLEVDSADVQVRIGIPSRSVSRTLEHLGRGIS